MAVQLLWRAATSGQTDSPCVAISCRSQGYIVTIAHKSGECALTMRLSCFFLSWVVKPQLDRFLGTLRLSRAVIRQLTILKANLTTSGHPVLSFFLGWVTPNLINRLSFFSTALSQCPVQFFPFSRGWQIPNFKLVTGLIRPDVNTLSSLVATSFSMVYHF